MTRFIVIAMAIVLTGCFSVEVSESPVLGDRTAAHVSICNYGWTLFGCVPLVCGNANSESWCSITFFRDEIKPEYAYEKLVSLAESKGCDLADVAAMCDNDVLFDAYYAPVPWVLVYKETNISGNLVRK